jgi:holliday junction DNA helicase RuvB
MTNKISRLIKRMTEEPFPTDGSLYDLGDGKVYQTEDGYTFHAVGDVSLLQNGCCGGNGVCSTTLQVPIATRTSTKEIKTISTSKEIFADILGYTEIKREFMKALQSSNPVGILLVGPPGCGKSEFLKQIRTAYDDKSVFIDGSYGSKAGIFEALKERRPKYVLLDEIDKLDNRDQQALLNLMESGRLTKTNKSEHFDIELKCWIFATANDKEDLLDPLFDRFERYFLSEYSDDEFKAIAVQRLKKEGIQDEELALYIANSVLRGLGRKSFRDAIRIARKCKTFEQVEETINTIKRYDAPK